MSTPRCGRQVFLWWSADRQFYFPLSVGRSSAQGKTLLQTHWEGEQGGVWGEAISVSHGSSAGWVGRLKGVKAQCHHYRCFSKLNFLFIYREKPRKKASDVPKPQDWNSSCWYGWLDLLNKVWRSYQVTTVCTKIKWYSRKQQVQDNLLRRRRQWLTVLTKRDEHLWRCAVRSPDWFLSYRKWESSGGTSVFQLWCAFSPFLFSLSNISILHTKHPLATCSHVICQNWTWHIRLWHIGLW